jgi:phenol/toluene 2-monooxygenase (NADH) P5/A5
MTYQLTVEPLGETIEVDENQTLLDALLRSGIVIPYACGHGLCSTCKVDVLEGDVDLGDPSLFALMDFEREEGKVLACCATARSDLVIEADVDEDDDSEVHPISDLTGTVAELIDLTHDTKCVRIQLPGDGLSFQAGQYVNLELPGIDGPRAFSLANPPSETNLLELHVKRVPGGAGTGFIHGQLKIGNPVPLSGPFGRFFVRKSVDLPMIFVAGGSGLSSPKSMVLDLLESGCTQDITLFHGVRSMSELYDQNQFQRLAATHDNFSYVPALSEPDDGPWDGETGFVSDVAARHFPDGFKGYKAYLCGPPPMIEATIRVLMKGRLFEKDIYTEKFVTQADGEAALARSPLFRRI